MMYLLRIFNAVNYAKKYTFGDNYRLTGIFYLKQDSRSDDESSKRFYYPLSDKTDWQVKNGW